MSLESTSLTAPGPPPVDVRRGLGVPVRGRRPVIRRRPVETETVSPLRRRQLTVRRKPRLWRRAQQLGWLLAIVAAPVATVGWLFTSQRFALHEVTVEIGDPGARRSGAARPHEIKSASAPRPPSRVSEVWVRQELAPFLGHNLLRLPLAAVAEPIEGHPWVRAVDVGKELPAGLLVRVTPRREAALLRHADELFYLDEEGRPIAPLDPADADQAGDMVVVSRRIPPAGTAPAADPELGAALDLLRELEAAPPRWLGGRCEIEVLGERDFKVITTGLPFPLLLQAGTVKERIRRLEDHLPQLLERYGSEAVIDLRFARRIIVESSPRERSAAAEPAVAVPAGTQRKGDSG